MIKPFTNEIRLDNFLHLVSCVMNKRSTMEDSSIVNQYVDVANLCLNLPSHAVYFFAIAHVTMVPKKKSFTPLVWKYAREGK